MVQRARDGERTRESILDAARDLIAEHGWPAVSHRAIAERAGVNLALINYHFGSQRKMLAAMLDRAVERILARHSPSGHTSSLGEFVRDAVQAIPSVRQDPDARVVVAAMLEGAHDEEIRPVVRRGLDQLRDHLRDAIEARGCPREIVSGLVTILAAAADGLLIHLTLDPGTDINGAVAALAHLSRSDGSPKTKKLTVT